MVLLEIVDAEKGVIEEGATASVGTEHTPVMHDQHIALVESIYESAILKLRLHYKVRIVVCVCACVRACMHVCVVICEFSFFLF